jgi:hypothetical protein
MRHEILLGPLVTMIADDLKRGNTGECLPERKNPSTSSTVSMRPIPWQLGEVPEQKRVVLENEAADVKGVPPPLTSRYGCPLDGSTYPLPRRADKVD